MPYKDKEKSKQYNTEYHRKQRAKNPEKYRERLKNWQRKNKNKVREYSRKYYWENTEKEIKRNSTAEANKKKRERHQRIRLEVLSYYGGNPPSCKCCKEKNLEFLSLDHINGGGNKQRKLVKRIGGSIFEWLRKSGYPKGYQVLCHNCNLAKGFYGYCPHKKRV